MSNAPSGGGRLAMLGQLVGLALAGLTLGGMVIGAVTYVAGDKVSEELRETVGIEALGEGIAAVQGQVERLGHRVDRFGERLGELEDGVRRLSGADRVIEVLPGTAYAKEPVYAGELVALHWTARRTELGASCEATSGTPVFTGADNVPTPGRIASPVHQWGTEFLPRRVLVETPETLQPGRVQVLVEVRYRCGDEIVFDRLPLIVFVLLPPPPAR